MQKHSIRQRIQRKEKWCHKMEKKLAVIVDKNEVTTEVADTEMCSSACDVAMETCSSESHECKRSESGLRSTIQRRLVKRAQSAKLSLAESEETVVALERI